LGPRVSGVVFMLLLPLLLLTLLLSVRLTLLLCL
jgi:hypothetical protein